jgi:hypothetical protein
MPTCRSNWPFGYVSDGDANFSSKSSGSVGYGMRWKKLNFTGRLRSNLPTRTR